MSDDAIKATEAVMNLTPDERRWVAERVWDAVETDIASAHLWDDPEFVAMIKARSDSVHDGTAELLDGEQVMAEMRERLRTTGGRTMSEAATKVYELAMDLPLDDLVWLRERLDESIGGMDEVPQDIIDAELAIVEERMAADELNPQPGIPWDEAMASIRAKLAERRAGR